MKEKLLEILACPMCKNHPLELIKIKSKDEEIEEGALYCDSCNRHFLIIEEIPVMLPDELRDKKQEDDFLKKNKEHLPEKITKSGKPWHL
tara:strand:+ start:474 stop:743 length:270 start_codon:yes stop_codon:yes gene_type:complete